MSPWLEICTSPCANSYFYPDVLVTCSALDLASVALTLSAEQLFADVLDA